MKRLAKKMVVILVVLLASTNVQAKLQSVGNFESLVGESPDGQACTGVLGGTWDTQSEGTGNIDLVTIDGSRGVSLSGNSNGNGRAIGFNGITNTIDNNETGLLFFRFMFRDSSRGTRTFMGLISDTSDDPVNSTSTNDPTGVPAGFSWADNPSGGLDVFTMDGATVLMSGLVRAQWYNIWIVANNAADTFDMYISEAAGPAGEATLPTPEDLVRSSIPFGIATTEPLTGMIISNPSGTSQAERIYFDEVYWDGDQGLGTPTKARNPSIANEESDVPRDVVLSWTPGPFAATHNVYFGTSFDDVNGGIGGVTQSVTSYAPAQRLDFGTTYYWRVDEVNAPPDSTIHQGGVWSFTTEPVAYAIENITATASSSDTAKGPENTVNGSGLDATGLLHTKTGDDNMWLSSDEPNGTWIEYEFDGVYKLYEMWVWNSNDSLEPAIGFGFKDVTIEYSTDGANWTTLGTTHEFTRAPGLDDYAHNTTVDLNGVTAKYVRLTTNSNWGEGLVDQYGLSEVRFFSIPVFAREPSPDSNTTDVDVDVTLGWRAGREAARHDVYLSTDEQAVIDGNAPVNTVTDASYSPLPFDLGSTYYWRIDEVNGTETPTTWQGEIWNLSTQEYLVVDDFESYNEIPAGEEGSNLIYLTWIDGYENPSVNGSTMGHTVAFEPSMESVTVYDGGQSAPLYYDNSTAGYSEATVNVANLQVGQDWTRHGIKALTLRFFGDPNNAVEQMYVKVNGSKVTYDGDAENLKRIGWQMWYIDLADFGLDLSNVTELSIGFERIGAFGGQGMVYLDGIRLYSHDRQVVTPAEAGTTGLQAHYEFEGTYSDSSGNARHGTAMGSPVFEAGKVGQAISLRGLNDYVEITGYKGILGPNAFSITAWIKTTYMGDDPQEIVYYGTHSDGQRCEFRVHDNGYIQMGNGGGQVRGLTTVTDGGWHHVAATITENATNSSSDVQIYVDGQDDTQESTDEDAFNLVADWDVTIGYRPSQSDRFFNGQIDDVRIYDRVLSQEEMAWLAGRTEPFDKPF